MTQRRPTLLLAATVVLAGATNMPAEAQGPSPANSGPSCAPKVLLLQKPTTPGALQQTIRPIEASPACVDPDGDALHVREISAPSNGAAARLEGDAVQISNLQAGPTTFFYTVSDGHGLAVRGVFTIVVR